MTAEEQPEDEERKITRVVGEIGDTGPAISYHVEYQEGEREGEETLVPVCSVRGHVIQDRAINFCCMCESKVCDRHFVTYQLDGWCVKCVLKEIGLGKLDYKVLRILDSGTSDVAEIARLARATTREVRASVRRMLDKGRLVRRGIGVFSKLEIPAETVDVAEALLQVYREERDVLELERELAGDVTQGVEA